MEIDEKTGEKRKDYNENTFNFYDDIENHWCKTAVERLTEAGISFEGKSFNPDSEITQLEMLKLFGAAVKYTHYLNMDADNLYKNLERENIVSPSERADSAPVLREDAFVYLVRFLGYERIAKAEDIFTTKFADQNLISQGKLGYASILSGLKVINGNGGFVKPLDKLTRAEAVVMIYNLLTKISWFFTYKMVKWLQYEKEKERIKMELKGSKTEKNLMAAFAGESQARNKYTYFASVAKKEG